MLVRDLSAAMDSIAPPDLAAPWDNVGLLVGAPLDTLGGPVFLTIDLTESVLDEAIGAGAAAIVAYHPPIFEPFKRLTAGTPRERIILRAARSGIAICSPHTALDAVPGGLTDWLCEGLSGGEPAPDRAGTIAGDCRALEPHPHSDRHQEVKIVTFVPAEAVAKVRDALAGSGAGIIGAYTVCSFGVAGMGTFLGGAGSNPTVGIAGKLEEAGEVRLEMVCSRAALPLALEALRRFHPYEEPAADVYALLPKPRRGAGAGRRLVLDRAVSVGELAARLKGFLGLPTVSVAAADPGLTVTHVGVCPGSGGPLASAAAAEACEVFVTGEMKHHDVLAAVNRGLAVILAGHTETERGYLPRLAARLGAMLPGVQVRVSAADRGLMAAV